MKLSECKIGNFIQTTDEGQFRGVITGFEQGLIRIRLSNGETLRSPEELIQVWADYNHNWPMSTKNPE
jgi:hypothetical protein